MNTTHSVFNLEHIGDDDLLASTRAQVGRSNQVFAGLLAHLAEVDARGLHRLRACSSLYTYCVYELRMSEDAAHRRAQAAKVAKRFPVLFERIAAGEIHLTGLLLLRPHLTEANHLEVLARAKHRTKREITALVRVLDPLPAVPPRIEPLGPAPRGHSLRNPTSREFAAALAGPVRELSSGDRPSDWVDRGEDVAATAVVATPGPAEAGPETETETNATAEEPASELGPQRYKVQFTASQEHVDLVSQARDLLGPAASKTDLGELHLRAMRLLVADLKKRKYALNEQAAPARIETEPSPPRSARKAPNSTREKHREKPENSPRQRDRGIPAAVRRAVAERDCHRCTYVDERGQRCRETRGLELHHEDAYAFGGLPTTDNIALRCRPHNALAAEQDFGRDFMMEKTTPAPAREL